MKIGICIREDYLEAPGGDTVQLHETLKYLKLIEGVSCHIITCKDEIDASFDIIHIFNIQNPYLALSFAKSAKAYNLPIALSTIYWDLRASMFVNFISNSTVNYFLSYTPPWFKGADYIFNILIKISQYTINKPYYLSPRYRKQAVELLKLSDILLPNSTEENNVIREHFKVDKPYSVVINAIDAPDLSLEFGKERNGVITVGRIEPTKNQINVLKALSTGKLKLSIIGRINDQWYSKNIERRYSQNINGPIGIQIPLQSVFEKMQSHRVHVLASYRESPGLSSLEALAMGCNIVVSEVKYCPVGTYFGDLLDKHVFTCDPYDYRSIRRAILLAYESDLPSKETIDGFRAKFSWEKAALSTYEAYNKVIYEK